MMRLAHIAALALALVAARGAIPTDEDGVLILDDSNFDTAVANNEVLLVEFYAPWCGHCKKFAPEYGAAARALRDEDGDEAVPFAKVDATVATATAQKLEIKGYPSLRLVKQGRAIDATDLAGRDKASLLQYVRAARKPRWRRIATVAEANEHVLEANGVRVVGAFKSEMSLALHAFIEVAEKFRYPVTFAYATDAAVKKHLGFSEKAKNKVLLFKPYDEEKQSFTMSELDLSKLPPQQPQMPGGPPPAPRPPPGSFDGEALGDWVELMMMPLLVIFRPDAVDLIFGGPVQVHIVLVVDPADGVDQELQDAVNEVALAHRGRALHILMMRDDENEEMAGVLEFLKVRTYPTLVLSDMTNATEAEPAGKQTKYPASKVKALDKASLLAWEKKHLEKIEATNAEQERQRLLKAHGLDGTFGDNLRDPKMAQMMSMIGMPPQLVQQLADTSAKRKRTWSTGS